VRQKTITPFKKNHKVFPFSALNQFLTLEYFLLQSWLVSGVTLLQDHDNYTEMIFTIFSQRILQQFVGKEDTTYYED
jgi:hypothetical protein